MAMQKRREKINLKYNINIDDVHKNNIITNPGKWTQIFLSQAENYANIDDFTPPGVEYIMLDKFVKNMAIAESTNPRMPIIIRMQTTGGHWDEGMAIYDTIKTSSSLVAILNYESACSMSSIIFLAGDKRVMMPNSYFMFHDGSLRLSGTIKQVESAFEFEKRVIMPTMWDIYARALKEQGKYKDWPEEKIIEMLHDIRDKKDETYLTAKQAVEWGFADEIFDGDWKSLTKYTNQQRQRKG